MAYDKEMYIVICPQAFANLPEHYIAFQMEQTVSSKWLNKDYYSRLENAYAIFDYSLTNIAFFKKMLYCPENL